LSCVVAIATGEHLHQLRQVPHLQLHLTLQLFAVVNEGHKRLLVAFSWRWSLSLPRRTTGSSPEDQKKKIVGSTYVYSPSTSRRKLGSSKLGYFAMFFFNWTPHMRNKNRTFNKLVMRPWKLGNLDVIFLIRGCAYSKNFPNLDPSFQVSNGISPPKTKIDSLIRDLT
jgi:hypothetical protein